MPPSTFADFWPQYLRARARPATRALHHAGIALSFTAAALALAFGGWRWAAVSALGYGLAAAAPFVVERGRRVRVGQPFRSLVAAYRLFFLWFIGRLGPHLAKAGVAVR